MTRGFTSGKSARRIEFGSPEMSFVATECNDNGQGWSERPPPPLLENTDDFPRRALEVMGSATVLRVVVNHN